MFPNLFDGIFSDATPWDNEPVAARLAAIKTGRPRIVWVYERPDSSTFRYRVYNMVESMRAAADRAVATWFTVEEIPELLPWLREIDTLVLARVRYDSRVARLISAARAQRVRVLFDCDDLVFDSRYIHLLLDTLDQRTKPSTAWDDWFAYIGRIEATARLCEGGIATNPFLARMMEQVVEGPVAVIPNYLNRRQQEASQVLFDAKRSRRFVGEGPVVIGYFSGTPSHNRDFGVAVPALCELLRRDPDVKIRVVGFMDSMGPLSCYSNRVERLPLQNWVELQRVIAEVEVNIAPLQENTFTNCKSELKFFEAAVVGTWTLATPTSTFSSAIRSDTMGRLTRAEDWDTALDQAVALARNPAQYALLAQANAAWAAETYGFNRFNDKILEATLANE